MNVELDWPTRMKNNNRTGFSSDSMSPPFKLSWKYPVGSYIWSNPCITENIVFTPVDRLHAISLLDGSLIWESKEIKAFGGHTSATAHDDTIFVCGVEKFYAIDKNSGEFKWAVKSRSTYSSPLYYQGIICWGTVDGDLLAFDAKEGIEKWRYSTGKGVHSAPSMSHETILFSSYHSVYALDARNGELLWRREFEEGVPKDTAAVHRNTVFVSVGQQGLVALDISNGKILWQYTMKYGPSTAPCIAENDEIVYVASKMLHAISILNGEEVWTSNEYGFYTSAPIVVGNHLFIGGGYGRLIYAFNRRNGEKVWEYPTGDLVYSTPAYANGRLVIGCHDGYIYCFDKQNSDN